MISAEDARSTVLRRCEDSAPGERFAIQSCDLSPRGDYWVVCCNSEDYVVHGMLDRCYVGVSAHLVSVASGDVETVGSAQSWMEYLQDKYDLSTAAGAHYVIEPTFDRTDKAALINLRQKLSCSIPDAIAMLAPGRRQWLTGNRRLLQRTQEILRDKGIDTVVVLHPTPLAAATVDERSWYWDAVASLLRP